MSKVHCPLGRSRRINSLPLSLPSESEGVPSTTIREISILKELKHDAVVELYDIIISRSDIFMVFEYLDMDLKKLLETHPAVFTPKLIKVGVHPKRPYKMIANILRLTPTLD